MAILNIQINGRAHQIACDDGQEAHLHALAQEIDKTVQELSTAMGGKASDSTLLALNSLMLLDELKELKEQNRALKMQAGNHSHAFESAKAQELESAVANAYEDAAGRVIQLSKALAAKSSS